jgi:hypothetical protein
VAAERLGVISPRREIVPTVAYGFIGRAEASSGVAADQIVPACVDAYHSKARLSQCLAQCIEQSRTVEITAGAVNEDGGGSCVSHGVGRLHRVEPIRGQHADQLDIHGCPFGLSLSNISPTNGSSRSRYSLAQMAWTRWSSLRLRLDALDEPLDAETSLAESLEVQKFGELQASSSWRSRRSGLRSIQLLRSGSPARFPSRRRVGSSGPCGPLGHTW